MSPSEKFPIPGPSEKPKAENPFSTQAEQKAEKNFTEPTPLEQLVPGIDLSRLTKKEKIEEYLQHSELVDAGFMGGVSRITEIGRDQSDTQFGLYAGSRAQRLGVFTQEKDGSISSRFQGKTIVDIGSGDSGGGYVFAQTVGAKAYIGVDPFAAKVTGMFIRTLKEFDDISQTIPWNCVESDALDFLSALPANSVCVTMFGIRDEAIPNQRLDAILKAISQKLDPDGAFFSMHSDTYKAKDIMDLDPKVEDDEDARQFIKRKG